RDPLQSQAADRARCDREQPPRHVRFQADAGAAAHPTVAELHMISTDRVGRFGGTVMEPFSRRTVKAAILVLISLAASSRVQAQGFVIPFVAFDIGPDAGCLNVVLCAGRYLNTGVGVGRVGSTYGVEEEVAYARDFFGNA